MTETYRSDHAADPELFEQLMRERYGPLRKVMAERNQPGPPDPVRRPQMAPAYQSSPDPDAAEHYARLKDAVVEADSRSSTDLPAPERTPPGPGMTWCKSCSGWCTPQGICGCNDR